MKIQAFKRGNSPVLDLPMSLTVGSASSPIEDSLLFAQMTNNKCSLEQLLVAVTRHNTHGEIDTGPPVGKELW